MKVILRRTAIIILLLCLIPFSLFASKDWVSFTQEPEGTPPEATVITSNYDSTVISYQVHGFWVTI